MSENKISVPCPNNPNSLADQFVAFDEIVRLLRVHCPWDREQTNESIAYLSIEEIYEMVDAIEKHDDADFAKELGDILLHVVMHALMAEERGAFSMIDVLQNASKKMVHRHPHVFGDVEVKNSANVLVNWESQKMKEGDRSVLAGVPKAMPSLLRAERIQHKAANVGFDWDDRKDVWNKVEEEFSELKEEIKNGNRQLAEEELGDFIFSIVNAARFEHIVAEEALTKTNNKFTRRFQFVEARAKELGMNMKDMTLAEMDAIWDEAKLLEKSESPIEKGI